MQMISEETAIIQKTRELCQALLEQPEVRSIRERINTFMDDDKARAIYDSLAMKSDLLHQKQHQGLQLSDAEIADYESHRENLINNKVAKAFLDAQQEMHKLQDTLGKYVARTLELGRVPNAEDFDSCCNDHGCGCSH